MQKLITLSNPRMAQAFVDYMAIQHVHIETKMSANQMELWLTDHTQLNFVTEQLDQFLANPMDKRYRAASWQTDSINTSFNYQSGRYWQIIRSKAGWLTLSVMFICVGVYLLMQLIGTSTIMNWFAFPADSDQYSQIWRWLTPAFIHFSITHITFNLVLWWYIGGPLEQRLGSGRLLKIMLVSAIASNYMQSLFSDNNFGGLSGVVYALVGYAWLMGEKSPQQGIRLDRSIMIMSVLWLFVGYFDILDISIANTAHVTGLVTGLALALWDTKPRVN